jgi:anti-sigma regulatory factor (Ser/Thr protein kinase)
MAQPAAASPTVPPDGDDVYHHEVFPYHDDVEYVSVLGGFVRDGLAAGEPVLVVLPDDRLSLLRTVLPDDDVNIQYADMSAVGDNPGLIIGVWRDFLDGCEGPARGIGEPVFAGRDPDQIEECRRHERLLDIAFAGRPFRLLCPYDAATLDGDVVDDALAAHPVVLQAGGRTASPTFQVDEHMDDLFQGSLPLPPATRTEMEFGRQELAMVRRFVGDQANRAGLHGDATADIVLAADEIATNYVVHGKSRGTVRCWGDGYWFVCEINGSGTIRDPFAGRIRPLPDQPGGRGLWLANQLCDLVQIRNTGDDSSVIRMRVRLPRH